MESQKVKAYFNDARDWFFQKRLGLFIHWGLYAINGWHEQELWRRRMSRDTYRLLSEQWNPQKFNPEVWLDLAQEAGMEYLVFTTKHHDGFCLYDSAYTDFKVTNSPYTTDILGQLSEACHKRNFPLGLYYSVVDWMHPAYPNEGRHHELPPQPEDSPEWEKYLEYLKLQVRELCTNYGAIHAFWWDMNVGGWQDRSVNEMIRSLQPACVINNRGLDEGDFGTPERDWNDHGAADGVPVEACQSVGMQSWGYREDESYYSDRYLMRSIDRFLVGGCNYLLNVGPDMDGVIPSKSVGIVQRIGAWYNKVRRSYAGNAVFEQMPQVPNVAGSNITIKGNSLFLHLSADFNGEDLSLAPIEELPLRAMLLNTGKELLCRNDMQPSDHAKQKGFLRVCGIPGNDLANTCVVIELEFAKPPFIVKSQGSDSEDLNIR